MQGQNGQLEIPGTGHHNGVDTRSVVRHDHGGNAVGAPVVGESAALISIIERAARDPSVDIDKFERLMLMKERVERQNAVKAFNDAISAAKGDIGPIIKNRTVDFTSAKGRTNYKHEDFAGITSVVDPVLKRHGLAYRFRSGQNGTKLSVTCVLSHVAGHSEETSLETNEDHSGNKNATQAIGSAATYLQRYTLKLALGLASAHDDDARASGTDAASIITDAQKAELETLIRETDADMAWICDRYEITDISQMTTAQFKEAKTGLSTRKRAMAGGK